MIPEKAVKLPHRTLREGEHTGHHHAAVAEDVSLFIDGDRLYMHTPTGTEIVHEEHLPIYIPPGEMQVGAVREFDYDRQEAIYVLD